MKKPRPRVHQVWHTLPPSDILAAIRETRIAVDLEQGTVSRWRDNRTKDVCGYEPYPISKGSRNGRDKIRIRLDGKQRKCEVSVIVWMAGANAVPPDGWQVHHRHLPGVPKHAFRNLLCVHPRDHRKIHADDAASPDEEPIPL